MPADTPRRKVKRSTPTSDGRQYLCRCLDCELEGWSGWGRTARREAFSLAKQHATETGHHTVVDECIYHSFEVTP